MPPTGFATCTYLVGWRTAEQAWGLIADETEWQTLLRGAAPCRPLVVRTRGLVDEGLQTPSPSACAWLRFTACG